MKDLVRNLSLGILALFAIVMAGGVITMQEPAFASKQDIETQYNAALKKGAPILVGYFTPT